MLKHIQFCIVYCKVNYTTHFSMFVFQTVFPLYWLNNRGWTLVSAAVKGLIFSRADEHSMCGSVHMYMITQQLANAALTAAVYVLFSLILRMFLLCLWRFILQSRQNFLTWGLNYISTLTLKLQGRATSHCIISRLFLRSCLRCNRPQWTYSMLIQFSLIADCNCTVYTNPNHCSLVKTYVYMCVTWRVYKWN